MAERAPAGPGWIHEIKFDGFRFGCRVEDGAVTLRTRNGMDWTYRAREAAAALSRLPDVYLDGELCVLGADGQPDFGALQKALRTDGSAADVVYFAFDTLFAGDEDLRERPLRDRKEILRQLIRKHGKKVGPVLRYVEHFDQDGPSIAGAACQSHLEGIVSKRAEAPYRPGKGPSWRKVKCRPLYDLVVAGWYPDRTGAVACLLMGAYDPAGDLVYVGRVGTGFTESGAGELAARLAPIAADRSPFRTGPRNSKHVRWVAPALVASITVTDWLGARIRHGSYKGVRTDVAPNDARLPPPRSPDPDDAGPGAHRRPRGHVKVGRAGYP